MDYLVASTIALIFSAGVLTLAPFSGTRISRLPPERRLDMAFLRKAFAKAAAEAGRRAASLRTAKRREAAEKELYTALSVLRNYASANDGASVTSDYLIDQFSKTDGVLKDAFAGTLRLLRTGRKAQAVEYFAAASGAALARDFIGLVLDWDAVAPFKLRKTVDAFQNALKEARTTELIRKNEILSDLVYLPVITGVLIVFINFIYVAYFAEQRALLAELFF